jgi:hypothetical protein
MAILSLTGCGSNGDESREDARRVLGACGLDLFRAGLKSYDLRYTIAHEIGHAIGLDHPAAGGQIMGYRYEEQFRDLQPGDIAGAVLLYGRRPSVLTQSKGISNRHRTPAGGNQRSTVPPNS